MNIDIDEGRLEGAIYDDRWLVNCKCGEHWYPSKKMFYEFLKRYGDVRGEVSIWSTNDNNKETCRIYVELEYPFDPDGYMNFSGRYFHGNNIYTEFNVRAKSFFEAIDKMNELAINGDKHQRNIEINQKGIWLPIKLFIEKEDDTE